MKENFKDKTWLEKSPIAHRGIQDKNKQIVENTLESIMLAVEKGYPVELDVRITNNNEIILLHDMTFKRVAGIKKHFSKLTNEDLKNIKLQGSISSIATLKQVLDYVNGRVPLLIELKVSIDFWRIKRLARELSKLLKDYKGEYAIQSFYPSIVKLYKKYDPDAPVGLIAPLFFPKKIFLNDLALKYSLHKYKYDFITYSINHKLNKSLIKNITKRNIPLLFYHITNEEKEDLALKHKGNLIWADYEEKGYEPLKNNKR